MAELPRQSSAADRLSDIERKRPAEGDLDFHVRRTRELKAELRGYKESLTRHSGEVARLGDQLRGVVAAREALADAKELLERHLLACEHADDVLSEIDAAIDSLAGGRSVADLERRRILPITVWLCPVHSEEFWAPHGGTCPEAGCDDELVPYALQRTGAVSVLERIREQAGKVCAAYETCEHEPCQASHSAWALADAYLRERSDA
jgi:hypothetical protein